MDTQARTTLDKIKEQLSDASESILFEDSESILFEDDEIIKERYYRQLITMKQDGTIKDFRLDWEGREGTLWLKLVDGPEFIELKMDVHPVDIKQE